MKKFLILSVVALAAVSVAVTAALAKPAKSTASGRHLRAASGPEVVGPLGDAGSSRTRRRRSRRPASRTSITNADGDAQKQKTQADQCLANGAKVVILVSLDAGSSIAIEKAAAAAGAKVIEYDRQVKGGTVGDLHLVRRRQGRRAPGPGRRRRAEGERHVQQEAGRRRAERRPDRQQLVPLQGWVRLHPEAALQARRLQEGPGSVHAGLGQPEGTDDLRADARSRRTTRSMPSRRPTTASRTRSSSRSRRRA